VDVLVNNAGGWNFNPIADVSEEEFDRYFALNAKSAFFGLQEAARRTNDGGRIVNISTAATVVAPAEQSVYVGAKAAAEGFARVAAKELGGRGITVNNVLAGATDTEQLASAVPEEAREQMARASVFGRLGTPRDIADVVAFLASEEARWVTGANISASGGLA
jgi:3-oxoacyl-[acyl-carrier protein] reductase